MSIPRSGSCRALALLASAGLLSLGVSSSGALAAGVALEQPAQSPASSERRSLAPVITAGGSATVARAPDTAVVWMGVQSTGKTALEAIDTLNRSMDRITKAVKNTQAPGLVVQTQTLSLQPQYRSFPDGRRTETPEIIGYIASNTISATTTDVARVGAVIDAGLAAGANQMNGLSFTLKDQSSAKREALAKAAVDARDKAEAAAGALGMRLGPVLEIQADHAEVRPFYQRRMGGEMAYAMADAAAAPTQVEAGQVEVSANVTVVYTLVPG